MRKDITAKKNNIEPASELCSALTTFPEDWNEVLRQSKMELGHKGEYTPKEGVAVVNINQRSLRHMGYQSLSEWMAASKDHL